MAVDRTVTVRFLGDADRLKTAAKQAETALGGVDTKASTGGKALGLLKNAAAGLAAGFAASKIADFIGDSVSLAIAAEDAGSKFETVFGPAVGEANTFVDEFANKAGFAEHEMQDMLGTLGNIVQGMGATKDESLDLSTQLATMAGDVASFNGATSDTPAVLQAMQSAINGEREALKTYGISVTEAEVQTEAFRQTGKKTASDLTQLEKAQATVAVITQKMAEATGDLDRTQDSLSNRQARLTAEWKDAQVTLGQALLPVLETVMPLLSGLVGAFGDLAGAIALISDPAKNARENIARLVEDLEDLGDVADETFGEIISERAVEAMQTLRISQDQVNELVRGSKQDFDAWVDSMTSTHRGMTKQANATRILARHVSNLRQDLADAREELSRKENAARAGAEADQRLEQQERKLALTTEDLAKKALIAAEANRDEAKAAEHSARKQAELEGSHDGATRSIQDQIDAQQRLIDQTRAMTDPAFALVQANQRLKDSRMEYHKALREHGPLSDEALDAYAAMIRAESDLEQANLNLAGVSLAPLRDELIESGIQAGLTAEQAEAAADRMIDAIDAVNRKNFFDKTFTWTLRREELRVQNPGRTYRGGRAAGGPVDAGGVYEVGEQGSEWFVPAVPGTIVPHHRTLPGGGGVASGAGGGVNIAPGAIQLHIHGPVTSDMIVLARVEAMRVLREFVNEIEVA